MNIESCNKGESQNNNNFVKRMCIEINEVS
jgi:hypothetical protein